MTPPTKTCQACGRTITWRAKWARNWDEVRYCSKGCRSASGADRADVVAAVRERMGRVSAGATACPSEVARAVHLSRGSPGGDEGWRALMEPVRQAARLLAADGELDFTQRGQVVDPSHATGPVRLRPRRH